MTAIRNQLSDELGKAGGMNGPAAMLFDEALRLRDAAIALFGLPRSPTCSLGIYDAYELESLGATSVPGEGVKGSREDLAKLCTLWAKEVIE